MVGLLAEAFLKREAGAKIVDLVTGRKEDDRHMDPVASNPPANLEAVHFGHVHIENDHVWGRRLHVPQRIEAVALGLDRVSGESKGGGDEVREGLLIVDHEDGGTAIGGLVHDAHATSAAWEFPENSM